MARFVLTAEAKNDLDQIWQYIAVESEIAADKEIAKIVQRFPRLAEFPEMGRERTELSPIYEKFSCWSLRNFLSTRRIGSGNSSDSSRVEGC
jgi:plasmid stabilization system protein ParE